MYIYYIFLKILRSCHQLNHEIGKMHYDKNCFQNIIPYKPKIFKLAMNSLSLVDDNIVPLTPILGKKGSDYINASYVNVNTSLVLVIY